MLLADYEAYIKCQEEVSRTYAVSMQVYSLVLVNLFIVQTVTATSL